MRQNVKQRLNKKLSDNTGKKSFKEVITGAAKNKSNVKKG